MLKHMPERRGACSGLQNFQERVEFLAVFVSEGFPIDCHFWQFGAEFFNVVRRDIDAAEFQFFQIGEVF